MPSTAWDPERAAALGVLFASMPVVSRLAPIVVLVGLFAFAVDADVHALRAPIVVTGEQRDSSHDMVWARRPQEEWVGYGGTVRKTNKPLALAEFSLTAKEGDHHIEDLGVGINSGLRHSGTTEDIWVDFDHKIKVCGASGDSWFDRTCSSNSPSVDFEYRVGMHEPQLSFEAQEYSYAVARSERCKGSCTISLGQRPAGHRFVLSGFRFHRLHDHALVHRVTVMPVGDDDITVRFQDDGNPEFQVSVHGLWLPERAFAGATKSVELQYQPGKPAPDVEIGLTPFALVGFDFEFLNGAHALRRIGLRYAPPNIAPRFADQNIDDPWRVKFKYAPLK